MTSNETQITLSAEKQFMFRDAFNRGFVQIPRMIVACLGLSIQAKGVYNSIAKFVYEEGKSAFPSVSRIALDCELTEKSVIKYIRELVDMGLLKKARRGRGRTNDYQLKDVHEVRLLHVSELLWRVLDGIVDGKEDRTWEKAKEALDALLIAVQERRLSLLAVQCTNEARAQIEADILSIMEGGKPTLVYIPQVNKPRTFVSDSPSGGGHEVDWKPDKFRLHFYSKYKEATGATHPDVTTLHRTLLKRILKQLDEDKSKLKRYIDAFFDIGYDTPSLEWFAKSGRITEIETFLRDGKKPFYLEKKVAKRQEAEAVQENTGIKQDDFIKMLRGDK